MEQSRALQPNDGVGEGNASSWGCLKPGALGGGSPGTPQIVWTGTSDAVSRFLSLMRLATPPPTTTMCNPAALTGHLTPYHRGCPMDERLMDDRFLKPFRADRLPLSAAPPKTGPRT